MNIPESIINTGLLKIKCICPIAILTRPTPKMERYQTNACLRMLYIVHFKAYNRS